MHLASSSAARHHQLENQFWESGAAVESSQPHRRSETGLRRRHQITTETRPSDDSPTIDRPVCCASAAAFDLDTNNNNNNKHALDEHRYSSWNVMIFYTHVWSRRPIINQRRTSQHEAKPVWTYNLYNYITYTFSIKQHIRRRWWWRFIARSLVVSSTMAMHRGRLAHCASSCIALQQPQQGKAFYNIVGLGKAHRVELYKKELPTKQHARF